MNILSCTSHSGMSSEIPDTFPRVLSDASIRHRCYICMRSLASAAEKDAHDRTEPHIMRCCKMMGWPTAMCILCRCFALLPVEEHVCTELHMVKLLQFPHYNGPALQVVAYPYGLFTESQRLQLAHSDEYVVVYTNHVRLHYELFDDYRRAHVETEIDDLYAEYRMALEQIEYQHSADWPSSPTSPELSSSDSEDENLCNTPAHD